MHMKICDKFKVGMKVVCINEKSVLYKAMGIVISINTEYTYSIKINIQKPSISYGELVNFSPLELELYVEE